MKEEHEAFLRGVGLYDKDWNLIATVVTTRSVLQIRTHGQKYFTKLAKGEVFPLEVCPHVRCALIFHSRDFPQCGVAGAVPLQKLDIVILGSVPSVLC